MLQTDQSGPFHWGSFRPFQHGRGTPMLIYLHKLVLLDTWDMYGYVMICGYIHTNNMRYNEIHFSWHVGDISIYSGPQVRGKNMDCAIVCHKSTGTDHLLGFHGQFMCSDCLKVPGGIPVTATQVCMDITGLDMETLKFLRRWTPLIGEDGNNICWEILATLSNVFKLLVLLQKFFFFFWHEGRRAERNGAKFVLHFWWCSCWVAMFMAKNARLPEGMTCKCAPCWPQHAPAICRDCIDVYGFNKVEDAWR